MHGQVRHTQKSEEGTRAGTGLYLSPLPGLASLVDSTGLRVPVFTLVL